MRVTITVNKNTKQTTVRETVLANIVECLNRDFALAPTRGVLDITKELQDEILADLTPILVPRKKPSQQQCFSDLQKVIEKINNMRLENHWRVLPAPKKTQLPESFWGSVIELHGYRWSIARGIGIGLKMRHLIYSYIATALDTGLIDRIRRCDGCKTFFVAEDPRRLFCSAQCRIDFNNKRRLDEGYFKSLRHKKRRTALAKARRLLQEGIDPKAVTRRIPGLSVRILEHKGLISSESMEREG